VNTGIGTCLPPAHISGRNRRKAQAALANLSSCNTHHRRTSSFELLCRTPRKCIIHPSIHRPACIQEMTPCARSCLPKGELPRDTFRIFGTAAPNCSQSIPLEAARQSRSRMGIRQISCIFVPPSALGIVLVFDPMAYSFHPDVF